MPSTSQVLAIDSPTQLEAMEIFPNHTLNINLKLTPKQIQDFITMLRTNKNAFAQEYQDM